MSILKGIKKYVGVVKESTWGTKVTTGHKYIEALTEGFGLSRPNVKRSVMRGGVRGYKRNLKGRYDAKGSIACDLTNEGGLPVLLESFMGTVETSVLVASAAWKHVFTFEDDLAFGESKGVTIKLGKDLAAYDHYGFVTEQIQISSASGDDPAQVSFDMIGKNSEVGDSASPVYVSVDPFMHHDIAITVDGSAINPSGFALTGKNNYKSDYYGGSAYRSKIPVNKERELTGKLDFDVIEDFNYFNKYIANTSVALVVSWTGALISGTTYHLFKLTIPKAYFSGPDSPGSGGVEIPKMECPFDLRYTDSSTLEMTLELNNTEDSI